MIIKQELFLEIINSINMSNKDINLLIKKILAKNQYKIFILRYTKNFKEKHTLREIGKLLNISHQSISESLIRSQTKIVKYLQKNKIIDFKYEDTSKKEQLIKSIKLLERLPHANELEFNDKSDQRGYFNFLKRKAQELENKDKDLLTEKEKQIVNDYQEILKEINLYENSIKLTSHTIELLNTINELKRLPKKYTEKGIPERVFSDGTNQRSYYEVLCKKRTIILDKKTPLTRQDKEILYNYITIRMELMKYKKAVKNILTKEEKKKELITYINEHHQLPPLYSTNDDVYFNDQTHKRIYYIYLKNKTKSLLELTRPLTREEQQVIDDYNEIISEWNKYRPYATIEEKTIKIIEHINKYHTLPESVVDPENRVNYKNYYDIILRARKRVNKKKENNIEPSKEEIEFLESYNQISNVRSFHPRKKQDNKELIEELCNILNINLTNNKSLLKKSFSEVYAKICFLIENNISITDNEGSINPIMFASDINIQSTYNISLEEIINKYINGEHNALDSINNIKRLIKGK